MDPSALAMAYQDFMRRRMMQNQQAAQYLQQASGFASPMMNMGHPAEPQYDMNNPHMWGLPDVMDNSRNMMLDLGGSYRNWMRRRETTKKELSYGDSQDPRRAMDVGI